MAPEIKFIHEYANCGNDAEMLALLMRYNLIRRDGKPFVIRKDTSTKLFYSQEELDWYIKAYPSGNPLTIAGRSEENIRLATCGDFASLMPHVRFVKSIMESLAKNDPTVLMGYAKNMLKTAIETDAIISSPIPDDPWHYQLAASWKMADHILPIEDMVEIHGILIPLHNPKSDLKLEYTKKCKVCGKIYQAKGQKAIYCSERCRSQARAQCKKEVQ